MKILIPTDFSENAHHAAQYAMRLFGDSATYMLVNAYQVPHSGSTMLISISDILKRDSEQLLKEEVNRLEDEFPDLLEKISVSAEMGQADTVLRKILGTEHHDLIVMGTKGATGLKSVLVGSVASNVMQNVPVSVLTVPNGDLEPQPERIVFAADDYTLQKDSCPFVLKQIAAIAKSKVMIVNVLEAGEKASSSDRMPINAFDGIDHSFHFENGKNVGEVIVTFAKEHNASMLAMVRRKKDLFSNLFGQSNTRQMIQSSALPLLVLPNDQLIA